MFFSLSLDKTSGAECHLVFGLWLKQKGGPYVGSIPIAGAQIGRSKESGDSNDPYQRHAFLIIESPISSSKGTRHVLCAESDEDRDEVSKTFDYGFVGSAWIDRSRSFVLF